MGESFFFINDLYIVYFEKLELNEYISMYKSNCRCYKLYFGKVSKDLDKWCYGFKVNCFWFVIDFFVVFL